MRSALLPVLLLAPTRSFQPPVSDLNIAYHLGRFGLRTAASRKRISIVTSGSVLGTCQWYYEVLFERNRGSKEPLKAGRLHTLSIHRVHLVQHGDIVCVSPQFQHELQATVLPHISSFTRVIVVVLGNSACLGNNITSTNHDAKTLNGAAIHHLFKHTDLPVGICRSDAQSSQEFKRVLAGANKQAFVLAVGKSTVSEPWIWRRFWRNEVVVLLRRHLPPFFEAETLKNQAQDRPPKGK